MIRLEPAIDSGVGLLLIFLGSKCCSARISGAERCFWLLSEAGFKPGFIYLDDMEAGLFPPPLVFVGL
jgi:hypothetical protein